MHPTRRTLVGLATAAALGAGLVAFSGAADAATPSCNGTSLAPQSSDYAEVPVRRATSAGSGTYNCITGRGSVGSWVRLLQHNLNLCNGQHLTVDGIYGPATQQAVRNVQSAHRISVDGVYGPKTRTAMRWEGWGSGRCALLTL